MSFSPKKICSFLAPIHGYTDLPFRLLCVKYGAGAACVPLINATAILRNRKALDALDIHEDERNLGAQLVGESVEDVVKSAPLLLKTNPSIAWLNINCGCPSIRTMESGGGSALLSHPEKIVRMIKGIQSALDIPLSIKIRVRKNMSETLGLCKMAEDAGVDFIIVHGRTPAMGYRGHADWELIRGIKKLSRVLIVGNGDIKNSADGKTRVDDGFCDGFMIARAAMSNPRCFSNEEPKSPEARFALLSEYISISKEYLGETSPQINDLKIKALQFVSGTPGAAALRNSISIAKTPEAILSLVSREI